MRFRYYVLKRLLMLFPTFIVVSFIMYYLLLAFSHGMPVVLYIPDEYAAFSLALHPEKLAALNKLYGFDKPWYMQWLTFFGKMFTGDLGYSPKYNQPVVDVIAKAIPATLEFVIPGILLALLIGIPYGIKSSVAKPKENFYITTTSLIGVSIPVFVVALFIKGLIWETFFYLGFASGDHSIFDISFYSGMYNGKIFSYPNHLIFGLQPTGFLLIDSLLSLNIPLFFDALAHLLGPIFCIMLVVIPFVVRMTRSAMTVTLKQDYVLLAKSKGLDQKVILYKHAFRNALLPMTTLFGYLFSAVILGTVYIEVVFLYPGIGYMFYLGINFYDLGLMLAFLLISTTTYILFNITVDLIYYFIDPRIGSTDNQNK